MNRKGFSLIEILIALAVGLVMITGTAELLILAARAAKRTEIRSAAVDILAARLEFLKSRPAGNEAASPGNHKTTETSVRGCGDFIVEWTVERISPECTTIVVEVGSAASPAIRVRALLHLLEELGYAP